MHFPTAAIIAFLASAALTSAIPTPHSNSLSARAASPIADADSLITTVTDEPILQTRDLHEKRDPSSEARDLYERNAMFERRERAAKAEALKRWYSRNALPEASKVKGGINKRDAGPDADADAEAKHNAFARDYPSAALQGFTGLKSRDAHAKAKAKQFARNYPYAALQGLGSF